MALADGTNLAATIGAGLLYGLPIAALLAFLVLWIIGVRGEEEPPIAGTVGESADDPVSLAYRAIERGDLGFPIEAFGAAVERRGGPSEAPRERRAVRRELRRLRALAARVDRPAGRWGAARRLRERDEFQERTLRVLAALPAPRSAERGEGP